MSCWHPETTRFKSMDMPRGELVRQPSLRCWSCFAAVDDCGASIFQLVVSLKSRFQARFQARSGVSTVCPDLSNQNTLNR